MGDGMEERKEEDEEEEEDDDDPWFPSLSRGTKALQFSFSPSLSSLFLPSLSSLLLLLLSLLFILPSFFSNPPFSSSHQREEGTKEEAVYAKTEEGIINASPAS
jgi:hypothetical protein